MMLPKTKTTLLSALKYFLKVFFTSVSITSIIALLFFISVYGYVRGFERGILKDINRPVVKEYIYVTTAVSKAPEKAPQISTNVKRTPWGGPELWKLVNEKRVAYGVNQLNQDDALCTIASIRLNELLELGKLDGHVGFGNLEERRPDLKYVFEKFAVITEFLASGGDTASETVGLWENTLAHKKLLTGGEYVWGCIYAQNTFAVAITAY